MSNIIPPLLSNTPPPIIATLDDDEEDEFGHFTSAVDLSYSCEALSVPSSPLHLPPSDKLDINSNTDANITQVFNYFAPLDKDYQDKRKQCDTSPPALSETDVNSISAPVDVSVDSLAEPQEGIEVNASVPECETHVPFCIEDDGVDRDSGAKTKPPNLTIALRNANENVIEFQELPELKLNKKDFNYHSDDDLHDSQQLDLDNCETRESKDNQVINSEIESSSKDVDEQGEEGDFLCKTTSRNATSLQIKDETAVVREQEEASEFADFQGLELNEHDGTPNSHMDSPVAERQREEFADFSSFQVDTEANDFGDNFCDFQGAVAASHVVEDDDNEFGDFGACPQSRLADFDSGSVLKNAEKIIADMFPVQTQESASATEGAEFVRNPVFQEIKDITETKALTYQWVKSSCQDNLLKALNIDTRNILYGAGWNPAMPKFAANLSFAPLEPMKTDILLPTSSHISRDSPTPSSIQPDIPSAQFDWSGSGLTNPLDYLEQLVASLDLTTTTTSSFTSYAPSPSDDFDEWEFWLRSLQKDAKENLSPKTAPRTPTNNFEQAAVRLQADNDSVNSLQFVTEVEEAKQDDVGGDREDDFGDFASYQSPKKNENAGPTCLKPAPDLPRKTQEEDDFTDFQAGAPSISETAKNNSGVDFPPCILEPLKPTVLKQSPLNVEPLQINWPAPGLTDDDIRNIELNYSGGSQSQGPKKPLPQKINAIDEDDWSDFVCNPLSAPPTNKPHLIHQSERSSTPELQLSVPQLTQLQPPKAPIPVITPNGLIQTKIPSNVPHASSFQPSYPPIQTSIHSQPSIISHQYQNHMNGPVFSRVKNGFTPGTTKKFKDDDDDWTDFISSPPAVQSARSQNGVAKNSQLLLTPNIITNPVHFDSYRNYASPQSVGAKKVKPIPSISALPDLDFIAPKNRTFTKK